MIGTNKNKYWDKIYNNWLIKHLNWKLTRRRRDGTKVANRTSQKRTS